jgi:hypothetical protein
MLHEFKTFNIVTARKLCIFCDPTKLERKISLRVTMSYNNIGKITETSNLNALTEWRLNIAVKMWPTLKTMNKLDSIRQGEDPLFNFRTMKR